MFKELKLKRNTFVQFNGPLQAWNFTLTGFYNGEETNLFVTISEVGTTSLVIGENKFRGKRFINEDLEIVELKKTGEYIKIRTEIDHYQSKMKNNLTISDLKVIGKVQDMVAVSFKFQSKVSEEVTIPLKEGEPDVEFSNLFSNREVFYLLLTRDKNGRITYDEELGLRKSTFYDPVSAQLFTVDDYKIRSSVKMNGDFFTHQHFLDDIVELIMKDKSVRIKILVS